MGIKEWEKRIVTFPDIEVDNYSFYGAFSHKGMINVVRIMKEWGFVSFVDLVMYPFASSCGEYILFESFYNKFFCVELYYESNKLIVYCEVGEDDFIEWEFDTSSEKDKFAFAGLASLAMEHAKGSGVEPKPK